MALTLSKSGHPSSRAHSINMYVVVYIKAFPPYLFQMKWKQRMHLHQVSQAVMCVLINGVILHRQLCIALMSAGQD